MLQLSVTLGGVQFTIALQLAAGDTVMFEGQFVNSGIVVSFTVTVNEHVALLPAASVAEYVTVVVPALNSLPGL